MVAVLIAAQSGQGCKGKPTERWGRKVSGLKEFFLRQRDCRDKGFSLSRQTNFRFQIVFSALNSSCSLA
jgi:hypothetical protein